MKYLISLYFDENTNKQICKYMNEVAMATGNDYMLVNKVPPHITVSSFEIRETGEYDVVKQLEMKLNEVLADISVGDIQWVGCGAFMNSVLYLTPVLNEYLQIIMQSVYDGISELPDVAISRYYKPFQWLPHTTIGKKMQAETLIKGFSVTQEAFGVIHGRVVRIGLAKAGPYEDIKVWEL